MALNDFLIIKRNAGGALAEQVIATGNNKIFGTDGSGTWSLLDTSAVKTLLTLVKADVGLDNVTNDAQLKAADLDTDTTLTANSDIKVPSQKAVRAFVQASTLNLWENKGIIDCSSNPNYPAASNADIYRCSVAGKIGGSSGVVVSVGDIIVCNSDNAGGTQASVGSSWSVQEANLPGISTVGNNLLTLANPSAVRFLRINSGNSVSALTAQAMLNAILPADTILPGDSTFSFCDGNVTGDAAGNVIFTSSLTIGSLSLTSDGAVLNTSTGYGIALDGTITAPIFQFQGTAIGSLPASPSDGTSAFVEDALAPISGSPVVSGGIARALVIWDNAAAAWIVH